MAGDVTQWAAGLDRAIRRAGIPIDGVSVGSAADRASWVIRFQAGATVPQRTQAQTIASTYDLASDTAMTDEDAQTQLDLKALKALAIWTAQKLNVPLVTMRAEVLAIYKALP